MNCFLCKGDMEEKLVTHTADLGQSIIIIKGVPAMVCSQCGEVWYSGTVIKQIEKIIDEMDKVITEIAVVNYSDRVA